MSLHQQGLFSLVLLVVGPQSRGHHGARRSSRILRRRVLASSTPDVRASRGSGICRKRDHADGSLFQRQLPSESGSRAACTRAACHGVSFLDRSTRGTDPSGVRTQWEHLRIQSFSAGKRGTDLRQETYARPSNKAHAKDGRRQALTCQNENTILRVRRHTEHGCPISSTHTARRVGGRFVRRSGGRRGTVWRHHVGHTVRSTFILSARLLTGSSVASRQTVSSGRFSSSRVQNLGSHRPTRILALQPRSLRTGCERGRLRRAGHSAGVVRATRRTS